MIILHLESVNNCEENQADCMHGEFAEPNSPTYKTDIRTRTQQMLEQLQLQPFEVKFVPNVKCR